jgi:hypothetical protein
MQLMKVKLVGPSETILELLRTPEGVVLQHRQGGEVVRAIPVEQKLLWTLAAELLGVLGFPHSLVSWLESWLDEKATQAKESRSMERYPRGWHPDDERRS